MRKRPLLAIAALFAALVLPGMAAAQTLAYTAGEGFIYMRSGPDRDYPAVARLYAGTPVDVLGCLETRAWCEVIVDGIRGWIFAQRLEFVYGGRRVLVPDYYTYFGAPYVIFRFDDDHHSRRRSNRYRDRDNYKEGFHPPGGGEPGPEQIPPNRTERVPPDDGNFGHPGGGGPGPDYIEPGDSGGPAGGGGGCRPPFCIEGTE